MKRRTILTSIPALFSVFAGCLDMTNNSGKKILVSRSTCGNKSVLVNFDTENHSEAKEQILDELANKNSYSESGEISEPMKEIYSRLERADVYIEDARLMKHDGTCYTARLGEINDD